MSNLINIYGCPQKEPKVCHGKACLIDGKYYLLVPALMIEKPRQDLDKYVRCREYNTSGNKRKKRKKRKRCKQKTRDISETCKTHRKKRYSYPETEQSLSE